MVKFSNPKHRKINCNYRYPSLQSFVLCLLAFHIIGYGILFYHELSKRVAPPPSSKRFAKQPPKQPAPIAKATPSKQHNCTITSPNELSPEERFPKQGPRHTTDPPPGAITLVCCETTKGPLSIAVHPSWAPIGAQRFLDLVRDDFFSRTPLFRCLKGFLCQFGIPADPRKSQKFKQTLEDDRNWLPEGPDHRRNENGTKRFARGYLAYAGGGKNTRDYQLIVSLKDNPFLGGGSPWEVPWGELVGAQSFETLERIYTGYGEEGPKQGMLQNRGMTKEMEEQFPNLDYLMGCSLLGV